MQNLLTRPQALVIQLRGSLIATNVNQIQTQLNAAILSERNSSLLLNMEEVDFIDCTSLTAILSTLKLAQQLNKRFALCSVPYAVRTLLELTQLDRVIELVEDRPVLEEVVA